VVYNITLLAVLAVFHCFGGIIFFSVWQRKA